MQSLNVKADGTYRNQLALKDVPNHYFPCHLVALLANAASSLTPAL
jgi:hypothetical protein